MTSEEITKRILDVTTDAIYDICDKRSKARKAIPRDIDGRPHSRLYTHPSDALRSMSREEVALEVAKVYNKTSHQTSSVRAFILAGIQRSALKVMQEVTDVESK